LFVCCENHHFATWLANHHLLTAERARRLRRRGFLLPKVYVKRGRNTCSCGQLLKRFNSFYNFVLSCRLRARSLLKSIIKWDARANQFIIALEEIRRLYHLRGHGF
jgi:hypothetical protein